MPFFCRRIIINKPENFRLNGPLLIACNHPNSFLDAVILADLFRKPVHALTRGDVFKKRVPRKILSALYMLPIYRTSEGVENLGINYQTFDECMQIFREKGIVLIFSEAKCINEWHLRPLRKGTARLAFAALDKDIDVQVLPVGLNYSSFKRFSKNLIINFGNTISVREFDSIKTDGKRNTSFNARLEGELRQLVFEIPKTNREKQIRLLEKKPSGFTKVLLSVPAFFGWVLHAPLYVPLKKFTTSRTWDNDHYDSVMVAFLIFTYPFYVALLTAIIVLMAHNMLFLLLILLLPFTAWCYIQLKPQLDK